MSAYVPYQVDYRVENKSRTIGFAKKKILFKFGIANKQALADGLTGSNCRGTEHEVVFVWSLKSGKRQIIVDNKEVHYSESGQNGWTADRTFQTHFTVNSPGSGMVRCHLISLPPDQNAPGGNKPFDIRIGGVSYFSFCKIYQLGTSAMIVRPSPTNASRGYSGMSSSTTSGGGSDAYVSHEERAAIAQAKLASLRDLSSNTTQEQAPQGGGYAGARQSSSSIQRDEGNLIDFGAPPAPPQQHQNPAHVMSSMTLDPALLGRSSSGDGSRGGPYGPSTTTTNPYAPGGPGPGGPGSAYGAPAASAYGAPAPASAYGAPAPAYGAPAGYPPAQAPGAYSNYALPPAPAPGYPPAPAPGYPPAPAPAQYSNYAMPPAADPNMAFAAAAPAPSYGAPAPQAAAPSYGAPAPAPFASPQSAYTYGSAPSFAQPASQAASAPAFAQAPPQQQQQQPYGGGGY